ncbi:MAG: TIGR02677 family protein [Pseudomonadota bacterium]|nr:TIGR02677 family protein [Pseudomonadota bacterium]
MPDTSFNYLTAEKTLVYRAVMRAFSEAKEHFVVHLRPEDVTERSARLGQPLQPEEAQSALAQLVEWGNLRAEPDTSRVTTVEDFYRARYLYQITREGEAAELALATFEQVLGRQGALQAVALQDIRTQLRALGNLIAQPRPDPAQAHLLLRDVSRVFTDLADNARAFMAGLGRGLELRGAERDAFIRYKDRLIEYLQRFIGDLVTLSVEIAGLIEALDRAPAFRDLLERVADREAADRAPDPEQADTASPAALVAAGLREWEARWEGLKAWFIGSPGHPSQADLLRSRARKAISQLLEAVVRLNERRLGRSDRSADFRTLARWFMECEDDPQAHRLWRAAFGLSPARHLTIDSDTLAARELEPVGAHRSWREAPPLRISPRLRQTGSYRKRGALPKVRNRAQDKRKLEGLLAAESAQTRAARRRLATGEYVELSRLGELDRDSFALFLRLLGEALSAAGNLEQPIFTQTGDASLAIDMIPMGSDTEAEIPTPDGVFRGRDYRLRITDLEDLEP